MADIVINLSMLEKILAKVVEKSYKHLGSTYLVIEELKIQTEEIEEATSEHLVFDYYIVGRYGVENSFDKRFDFLVSSNWDYNFLAGYFARIVDEADENE